MNARLSVLDEPNLPNPFQDMTDSDVEEANKENSNLLLDSDSEINIAF